MCFVCNWVSVLSKEKDIYPLKVNAAQPCLKYAVNNLPNVGACSEQSDFPEND